MFSFLSRLLLMTALVPLASCVTLSHDTKLGPEPSYVAPEPATGRRVALVLSGGTARGFAHIGVIKVLEANGLRPDIVVGSSAGSIVGALYASGLSARELEAAMAELGRSQFADIELMGLGIIPGSMGFVRGERLHEFVDARAKHHLIEQFPIRFAAVATNLATGESQIFNAGDVGRAVRASSSVPGILSPVRIGGNLYSDGQLSSPIPVDAARRLGARTVIAVDVIYPPEDAAPRTAFGVLFQAFAITVHRLRTIDAAKADLLIAPDLPRTSGQFSFRDRERLVAAGERAAQQVLEKLRANFATDGR